MCIKIIEEDTRDNVALLSAIQCSELHNYCLRKQRAYPKIITLEGTDCSFKETNANKLYNYIKNNITDKVKVYHFPNYDSDNEAVQMIKKMLNGEKLKGININNPRDVAMLYALDRYYTLISPKEDKNIYEYLDNGYYIIFDRYVYSNIIYQAYNNGGNEEDLKIADFIMYLEHYMLGLPYSNINIALISDYDLIKNKMKARKKPNGLERDIYEEDEERMRKSYDSLITYANKFNFNKIYVTDENKEFKSKEDIFNEILSILNKYNFL